MIRVIAIIVTAIMMIRPVRLLRVSISGGLTQADS